MDYVAIDIQAALVLRRVLLTACIHSEIRRIFTKEFKVLYQALTDTLEAAILQFTSSKYNGGDTTQYSTYIECVCVCLCL